MPTFDYKCKCGKHVSERVNKWDDEVHCACGKVMSKQASAPNLGGMDKLGRTK